MSERRFEVKTFITKLMCDNCNGLEEMKRTGRSHLIYPPESEYKCQNCGHTLFSPIKYPATTYEEINV